MGIEPDRVQLQYNGVNGAVFSIGDKQEARKLLDLPADRKLIVYVGNILPVKGTDVLVDSMKHLVKLRTDADLLIVGGGELEETVKTSAQELGDRVRFIPRQPHDRVPLWIRACDVFCLPSRNRRLPQCGAGSPGIGAPCSRNECRRHSRA
ncbi:MAG: glycosyltransferase [Armatimonas sp.]